MSTLLLELYSQEIPAQAQMAAISGFSAAFSDLFNKNAITFKDIEVLTSPCRIIIITNELNFTAKLKTIRGPKEGATEQMLSGFCNKHQVTASQLTLEMENNVRYYVLKKQDTSSLSSILLSQIPQVLGSYVWPKSMRWASHQISWIRPLENILCLLDDQVLPFVFGHLQANNCSFGHKFSKPESFQCANLEHYFEQLDAQGVIACQKKRKNLIAQQIEQISAQHGLEPVLDKELLDEVTALVEWPKVLLGKIEQRFMLLPPELLTSSMRQHQKYFTTTKNAQMASYFLFVCNLNLNDYTKIIADNERVLQARLSDGLHFYQQDLQTPLIEKLALLRNMTFHSKLGSLADKSWRIEQICRYLDADNSDLHLAAKLCKCDLASLVVGEFCQLQGIISRYYALAENLSPNVANIIAQHYKPVSINDEMPQGDSAILSLADKLDSLVCLMLAGERATSSKDPYALRRQAGCVLRIVLQLELNIDLDKTCQFIASLVPEDLNNQNVLQEIRQFILERLRHYLNKTYGEQIGNCLMPNNLANLAKTPQIAASLMQLMQTPLWTELLSCYKRLCNISGNSDAAHHNNVVNDQLFTSIHEQELFTHYQKIVTQMAANTSQEEKITLLSTLIQLIAAFFDNVLVNAPEVAIAQNRLTQVLLLKSCFEQTLNFASFL